MSLIQTTPYIEAHYKGKKQNPKSISLRLSETTSAAGAALGIANYWHSPQAPLEIAHYVVDETLVFQCVRDNQMCADFAERGVVCINVCGIATDSADTWIIEQGSVLENTAKLVAQLCWRYGIPDREIGLVEHRRFFRRGGIMVDVRGAWPRVYFFTIVKEYLNTYKEQGGL